MNHQLYQETQQPQHLTSMTIQTDEEKKDFTPNAMVKGEEKARLSQNNNNKSLKIQNALNRKCGMKTIVSVVLNN